MYSAVMYRDTVHGVHVALYTTRRYIVIPAIIHHILGMTGEVDRITIFQHTIKYSTNQIKYTMNNKYTAKQAAHNHV